ncbi:MAG TPA: PQQ-dependent sugar dehydrogenase [Acidimicrobiia bacterium]|nr:PQQ-dependent sugar dehydrogenase [Acidimicrobiia bacterium]
MSARHRQPAPNAQSRLRALIIALVAIFLITFFFLRGSGEGSGPEGTEAPVAGGTTTTLAPGVTATTVPGTGGTTVPGASTTAANLPELQELRLESLTGDVRQPTAITAPVGDDRLFVVERFGVILMLDANRELQETPFLDLTDRVLAGGIEQGMLGLAFHPDYANNGRFYVYYTDQGGRRQVSEFQVSVSDPNIASPDTERVLIELEQPPDATDIRHYAGQLAFGPEGYLWIAMGDGADSRDQGQDPNTMFGAISRIDVDGGDPYGIPPENPFVDGGGAGEVWAYGLRNPWRFSIDPVDGLIYIADVGHADQEEVNVLPIAEGGFNLGWSDVEGTRCFHVQDCDLANYTSPAITYTHEEGCSVTGGYVYRGAAIPELNGTYFYSDWCSQWIRSFKFAGGAVTEEQDWSEQLGELGQVNTFGIDSAGELYLGTHEGIVARLVADR